MEATFSFAPKTRTMRKFTFIEAPDFFLLISTDKLTKVGHILQLNKLSDLRANVKLADVIEPGTKTVNPKQMEQFMDDLKQKYSSSLKIRVSKAHAVLGFIRFLKGFYIILVTKRKRVSKIGLHSIYEVSKTEMIPLFDATDNANRDDENFYVSMFQNIEMQKTGFYFSYTYDLTNSLQENILRKIVNRMETVKGDQKVRLTSLKSKEAQTKPWETMFMWNKYLVEDFYELVECKLWVLPFVHGYISQINFQDMNKKCSVTLISRRSRLYAGTRYLKRGINELGHCANQVETEQILSVHTNSAIIDSLPIMSSYVQLRASIPFFWSQTPSAVTPKPDIIVDR